MQLEIIHRFTLSLGKNKRTLNKETLRSKSIYFHFFRKCKPVIRHCQLKMKINAISMVDITTIQSK